MQCNSCHTRRALEELNSANADRFGRLLDAAREQSAGSGESDLRRLKRQFSTLKNTFLHYDVKEAFIDGADTASALLLTIPSATLLLHARGITA